MHMVKVLLTEGVAGILALGLLVPAAFAQEVPATGTVTGIVTWGPDANPAAFTLVRVEGTDITARTDAQGKFTMTGVPAGGAFTIDAYADAEQSGVASRYDVPVQADQTLDIGMLNLSVSPEPGPPPPEVTPSYESGANAA
jgi:hypothetical protein